MHDERLLNDVAATIRALAKRHRVSYVETANDVFGKHITRLSGDDVVLDDTELLLIALYRAGNLSPAEVMQLQTDYLHQAKS